MKKSFIIPFGLTANDQALFVAETIYSNKKIKEFEFYTEFDTREDEPVENLIDDSVILFVDDTTFPGVKVVISSSARKAKRYFRNLALQ